MGLSGDITFASHVVQKKTSVSNEFYSWCVDGYVKEINFNFVCHEKEQSGWAQLKIWLFNTCIKGRSKTLHREAGKQMSKVGSVNLEFDT